VAYYIAQINLLQGRTAEAISYVEKKLADQNVKQFYSAELHQLLGHLYFTQQNYAKASPHLSSYIDLSEKVSREDVYELAYCHYKQNNLDDAIAGFRQLSGKEDSLSQHAMYLLGDAYIKKGDRNSARNAFLYCAANSSDLKQKEISSFQYAKLSYDLGFQDEALRSLKAFKTDYSNSTYLKEATELLVDVLATTNNYKDALELLESVKDPSAYVKKLVPRILYGRAMEFLNDGDDRAASSLIDRALADLNNQDLLPYLNFWKGELLFKSASYYQSIDFLNAYLKSGVTASNDVSKENASYTLGYCYLRLKQFDKAKNYFETIAKTTWSEAKPLNQDIAIRFADCYYMLRDFAKAKSLYEKSVQYQWNSADYCTYQLAMIAGVKSSAQKIGLLTGLIKQFPNSSLVNEAKMQIADTYMGDEKYKEAQPYLLDLIATSANGSFGPSAYLKSGIAYYNNDDNAKAVQQFKALVDKFPNTEELDDALDNLKAIYVEEGKGGEYLNYMHQIGRTIEASTEDSLTYLTAEKLLNDQKAEEALISLKQYLIKFPQGNYKIDANYFIAQLLADKKDFPNAITNYNVVIASAPNRFAESALLAASRINFFELKDYAKAEESYLLLKKLASTQENKLESLRGLLRSQYLQQKWEAAASSGKELIAEKGVNADDKALNAIANARSLQLSGKTTESIAEFKSVLSLNKAGLAAEARYEIAAAQFLQGNLKDAEKSAFETINKSGSYGFWVTRSYILLGDIYNAQKDYFNAKATFESVSENSDDEQLKKLAQDKLAAVIELEKTAGKIGK
jgi:TolA-binding protein